MRLSTQWLFSLFAPVIFLLLSNISPAQAGGLPPGFEKWESQCTQNSAKSCFFFAHRLMNGDQIKKDPVRATGYYQKACKLGIPDACYYAGRYLYYGEHGVPANKTASIAYLAQSCKTYSKQKWVCYNAAHGLLYNPKIVSKPKDAFYFAYLGCKANDKKSCGLAGYLAMGNDGVNRHPEHALSYLKNGCTLGDQFACHHLAKAYAIDADVQTDLEKAVQAAKKAYKLDANRDNAYLAGFTLILNDQYKASIPYFTKACEEGFGHGCSGVGSSIQNSGGKPADAKPWYVKGCKLNDQRSCQAVRDIEKFEIEWAEYERKVAAYEAAKAQMHAKSAKVTAALEKGDYNSAMNIATYGIGSRKETARVLIAAHNAGALRQIDDRFYAFAYHWVMGIDQQAYGIALGQYNRIRYANEASQRNYRVAPVYSGPQAPHSLHDQAMKFYNDSYRRNLNWYNRGGSPSDSRVYNLRK